MQRKAARGPMHRAVEAPMAARKASRRQSLQMTAKMGFGNAVETAGERTLPAVSYRPASSGVVVTAAVPEVVAEDTGPDWDALTFVNPRTFRSMARWHYQRGTSSLSACAQAAPDSIYFSWCNKDAVDGLDQICDNDCLSELWMSKVHGGDPNACRASASAPGPIPPHMPRHGARLLYCKPTPSTFRIRSRRTNSGRKSHSTRHVCRTQRAV